VHAALGSAAEDRGSTVFRIMFDCILLIVEAACLATLLFDGITEFEASLYRCIRLFWPCRFSCMNR
jgi:hypothetical protein